MEHLKNNKVGPTINVTPHGTVDNRVYLMYIFLKINRIILSRSRNGRDETSFGSAVTDIHLFFLFFEKVGSGCQAVLNLKYVYNVLRKLNTTYQETTLQLQKS